ncbi:MAG TPA: hypothetical protein QF571_11900, partial [Desulfobacterales bacterium]|nr:hypothetical protein [Desulfobacterales bacterium]
PLNFNRCHFIPECVGQIVQCHMPVSLVETKPELPQKISDKERQSSRNQADGAGRFIYHTVSDFVKIKHGNTVRV